MGMRIHACVCVRAHAWKERCSAVSPQLLGSFFLLLIREKASATRVTTEGVRESGEFLHCKLTLPIQLKEIEQPLKVGFYLIWQ